MMKMLLLGIICTLLATTSAEFCYSDVEGACNPPKGQTSQTSTLINEASRSDCNATYGSMDQLIVDLQTYANHHIHISFQFLLMSTYFGNYEANRDGFKALYRKLSDDAWEKGIDIIKYITKRGGTMNFNEMPHTNLGPKGMHVVEQNEIHSLAKALDFEKFLANEGLRIHSRAENHKDGAIAHYLEEKFMESQTQTVRSLSGHITDLKNMLNGRDGAVAVYLFDEYLKKSM
ncbi:ferritin light chain, oocyte isoform [Copidosoma floridanum]|uniref:ferritin light chain, oocyte isoform n=1 Tax=Copidosoma floridanum TaxID=29053 RepID=UPI0006C9CCF0|nr:ferritin light chain, oocyte isoform [Copidosoma floridanum]XP_014218253.1 ferritin light chain, oocyte isoform [Copidosoma floridanum]XP_014218254.1 ferritin light chain, oocyte isoform [Copidosoma floridanum]